jgi:hypothetical protein
VRAKLHRRPAAIAAALVVMAAVVTLSAVFTYRDAPSPPAATRPLATLATEFTQLEHTLHAKMGIAVSAIGTGQTLMAWGDWQEGPAWSTIKVPLVIAAYRQGNPPQVTSMMTAAITESDNAAAESLWAQLGDPSAAAQRVQQTLQETGDPTSVESRRLRPEFTAFGQTIWSLTNQIRFIAGAFCDGANDPIFHLMGQVVPNQTWGIGDIPGAEFKGGWGPSPSGKYLVRQIGVLTAPTGKVAVAIAAEPASGSFDDGTHDLGEVAKWLSDHLTALPAGQCGR